MAEVSFGEWLKRRRKALGLTQEQLALQISCSTSALRKIEGEDRRPSAQNVERLAEIFNIPLNERTSFLRFARGDWEAAPVGIIKDAPWRVSSEFPRSNLPASLTSLIGRERELARLGEYLSEPGIRLVTLIGPPGIGKTRLSLEVAREAINAFAAGVFFVALAPLDDSRLVALTIVQALGFVETKSRSPLERLKDGIGDKQMLLVLDNVEHLIEGTAPLVSDLLVACSRLKILTTSREALRVPGEWLYPVPALNIPAATQLQSMDMEGLSQFAALTLFAERARAVRPDFALNTDNIQAAASICAQLDGLPLAIELIAARIRWMSPQALLERLSGQFLLTADGMRAASERQKTLQQAIDWSYQLLQPEEQKLFAYLSVFTGSFSLETVEAVIPKKFMEKPVHDLVASLLDKSLLKRAPDFESRNEVRYTMLVTLREYARSRLQEMGEETEIRNRHLTYYLGLAEKASHELRGPHQAEWFRGLASVRDDLRSALDWAIETQQTEVALQMGSYLSWFWFRRSDFGEGRRWLGKVVNLPDASQYPHWYSDVLTQLARSTWLHVGAGQARPFVEKAISVAHQHDDQWNVARASLVLRLVLISEGDFTGAQTITAKSKTFFRNVQDEWGYAQAVLGHALSAFIQDDLTLSLALHEESLAIFRQFGDKLFQNTALRFIGIIQVRQGNLKRGREALREALLLAHEIDSKYEIAAVIRRIGDVALAEDNPVRAIHLKWASRNICDLIGVWRQEGETEFENELAPCRTRLSEPEFAEAEAQGRAMTMDQAIAYALENQGG